MKVIFSENLKALMATENLSQSELGRRIKVSQNSISSWVNGKKLPDLYSLCKVAKYFHETLDALVEYKEYDEF